VQKKVILKTTTQVDSAISYIKDAVLADETHEVIIQPHKASRSLAQNSLLHKWFGEISKETGETPEDVKFRYKKAHLIDIFMRREDSEYAQTVETLRELYRQGYKKDANFLHSQVVRLTSTADCTVAEMQEFLELIEIDCAANGFQLSRPEEYYKKAMGVK
jgi:hypothetical protein